MKYTRVRKRIKNELTKKEEEEEENIYNKQKNYRFLVSCFALLLPKILLYQ